MSEDVKYTCSKKMLDSVPIHQRVLEAIKEIGLEAYVAKYAFCIAEVEAYARELSLPQTVIDAARKKQIQRLDESFKKIINR